jgi:hypothetical protein
VSDDIPVEKIAVSLDAERRTARYIRPILRMPAETPTALELPIEGPSSVNTTPWMIKLAGP